MMRGLRMGFLLLQLEVRPVVGTSPLRRGLTSFHRGAVAIHEGNAEEWSASRSNFHH